MIDENAEATAKEIETLGVKAKAYASNAGSYTHLDVYKRQHILCSKVVVFDVQNKAIQTGDEIER